MWVVKTLKKETVYQLEKRREAEEALKILTKQSGISKPERIGDGKDCKSKQVKKDKKEDEFDF